MQDPDIFLKQEVESASPAKLRWLLIRKAVGLSEAVEQLWAEGKDLEAAQWWLRVREILTELLEGVTDKTNPAAEPIADLYIYLSRLSIEIEATRDLQGLAAFTEILKIEQETWDIFHRRESQSEGRHMHLGMSDASQSAPVLSGYSSQESGFSFEA